VLEERADAALSIKPAATAQRSGLRLEEGTGDGLAVQSMVL